MINDMKLDKRITLLCGHYGSGKTNVAVNMAMMMKKQYDKVTIADLDIVNPYFRTKDSSEDLAKAGINLICSEFANSNVDIPALPQEMYSITDDTSHRVLIDVGGDDRGALALGRLAPEIIKENDYEMLMVINKFRPLTRTVEDTLEVMGEIEFACGIKFTGLVNNSNLGEETTAEDVLGSLEYANGVSTATGLPIFATAFKAELYNELSEKVPMPMALTLQDKIL